MLTGKEELPPPNTKVCLNIKKSAKGNAESDELPKYLRSTFAVTYQQMEPARIPKGKKVFPQFAYGNSIESPSYLRTPNSLICRESYDNPYLKTKKSGGTKLESLRSNTLNNYDFYNVSDQRFYNQDGGSFKTSKITDTITNQTKLVKTPTIMIEDMNFEKAYKTLQPNLFKRQRELFTDFVEKNDCQNVYGPLNMRDRPKEFRETKNYALDEKALSKLRELKTTKITSSSPINRSKLTYQPKSQRSQLPQLQNAEKYYKKDKKFLNQFNNSIIREKIDLTMKNQSLIYNSDKRISSYNDNEDELIEQFEKHLEFEKQFIK